ncbi:MAG: hypothetical protein PUE51_13415 [Veillonellaceae bacterium]|nr:hypothetical protein [Veillonellaceae bacterium]
MAFEYCQRLLSSIMYNDTVTVERYAAAEAEDGSDDYEMTTVYEDIPCKLSQYGKDLLADKTAITYNVTTDLRLCLPPAYIIEPNDVMHVTTREGRTFTLYAGVPFVYPTHQEISVRRQKEGA